MKTTAIREALTLLGRTLTWDLQTADRVSKAAWAEIEALESVPEDVARDAQNIRYVLDALTPDDFDASLLNAARAGVNGLATAAARAPGLEADRETLTTQLHRAMKDAETAESERDAARREVETANEQLQTVHRQMAEVAQVLDAEVVPDGWGAHAAAQKRMAEHRALTARVAELERQGTADWNACCDVLVWTRSFRSDLPSPSRAVVAVIERLTAAEARTTAAETKAASARDAGLEDAAKYHDRKGDEARKWLDENEKRAKGPVVRMWQDSLEWHRRAAVNIRSMASQPAPAPTPAPGLREAVGPFVAVAKVLEMYGDVYEDPNGTRVPDDRAVWHKQHGAHMARVTMKDCRALRAAYDAAEGGEATEWPRAQAACPHDYLRDCPTCDGTSPSGPGGGETKCKACGDTGLLPMEFGGAFKPARCGACDASPDDDAAESSALTPESLAAVFGDVDNLLMDVYADPSFGPDAKGDKPFAEAILRAVLRRALSGQVPVHPDTVRLRTLHVLLVSAVEDLTAGLAGATYAPGGEARLLAGLKALNGLSLGQVPRVVREERVAEVLAHLNDIVGSSIPEYDRGWRDGVAAARSMLGLTLPTGPGGGGGDWPAPPHHRCEMKCLVGRPEGCAGPEMAGIRDGVGVTPRARIAQTPKPEVKRGFHDDRACGACDGPLETSRDAVCEKCAPESTAHATAESMAQPKSAAPEVVWEGYNNGQPARVTVDGVLQYQGSPGVWDDMGGISWLERTLARALAEAMREAPSPRELHEMRKAHGAVQSAATSGTMTRLGFDGGAAVLVLPLSAHEAAVRNAAEDMRERAAETADGGPLRVRGVLMTPRARILALPLESK